MKYSSTFSRMLSARIRCASRSVGKEKIAEHTEAGEVLRSDGIWTIAFRRRSDEK